MNLNEKDPLFTVFGTTELERDIALMDRVKEKFGMKQDRDLAEQAESGAGADRGQPGGGYRRGGGEQGIEGRNRAGSLAEGERQQHPAGQNVDQVAQRHHPDRMETVHETAEP